MGGSIFKPLKSWKHLLWKPHTIKYPYEIHKDMMGKVLPTDRYRGTHTNDLTKCIGCQMCGRICMNAAITYVDIPELKGVNNSPITLRPVIDYGRCCYCGLCTDICPTKSLQMTSRFEYIDTDKKTFKSIPTHLIKEKDGQTFIISKAETVFDTDDLRKKLSSWLAQVNPQGQKTPEPEPEPTEDESSGDEAEEEDEEEGVEEEWGDEDDDDEDED